MKFSTLPTPTHFDRSKADQIFQIDYSGLAAAAHDWKNRHGLKASAMDSRLGQKRIGVMPIDDQITFCIPTGELYVGGRSGRGAVDDSARFAEFAYREMANITVFIPTMDTHRAGQIFHPFAFVDDKGHHPNPFTPISEGDLVSGKWQVNPAWASMIGVSLGELKAYVLHYVRSLAQAGRGALMIWPYHSMLGGIGHAMVPLIEEAIFFHSVARASRIDWQIKGGEDRTENYSILRPEVLVDQHGVSVGSKNKALIEALMKLDALVIAGQARSHCVAWSIQDFLDELVATGNGALAKKVYLLEDCSTSVYVPPIGGNPEFDAEPIAKAAFDKFAAAGMNIVRSTDAMETWVGMAA